MKPRKDFTAYEVAKHLIKSYVERGDSLQSLKSSYLGHCSEYYWASIGGWLGDKHYSNDKIIVSEINRKPVNEVFSLKKIYEEILKEKTQLRLFD